MTNKKSSGNGLRSALITVAIILVIGVGIVLLQVRGNTQVQGNAPSQPAGQSMTLDPQIGKNLTEIPHTAPLTGDAADQVNQLKALVEACPDYTTERLSQMEQHISWLLNPATIPPEMIIALGANPPGKLVYGMATYTSIQWSLNDHAPDSCLLPIGTMLNTMLVADGEEPFPAFAQAAAQ